MIYSLEVKDKAVTLRSQGYSLKEITDILGISHSTASRWVREVILDEAAKVRIEWRREQGRINYKKYINAVSNAKTQKFSMLAQKNLSNISFNKALYKLLCAIFIWTEGAKINCRYVSFMNSDPLMIATFLKLLRASYTLYESKLRALVHIHEYHDDLQIRQYWSKISAIPLKQFNKSYLKSNTKKIIRANYKGCIRISYYDAQIAYELRMIYNIFAKDLTGGVVQW